MRTPARSAIFCECGGQNRRCRLDRPHHRSESFPYHEPSRQTGEVRRAHVSACATTRRAVLGSEPRARAYRAGRSASIRRLGEAPWSARIVIMAHLLLPGQKSGKHPESPGKIFMESTSQEKLLELLEYARVLMAACLSLRLGFALSLTGTGYVDLSLLHVPGNLRVTFVYARVTCQQLMSCREPSRDRTL